MRVSGTLLIVILAAAARGGDAPAPAGDSIADAKKDLASIKASAGQQESGAALPTLDIKDLTPGPGGGRQELPALLSPEKDPSLDPAKRKEGTGNWLVDAMDKKSDHPQGSKARERDDALKGDLDLLRGDERTGARGERDAASLDDAREKAGPGEPAEPVYNPLDSFMGSWISARDHDLLLSSAKGDQLPVAGLERAHADMLPGLDLGMPGSLAENLLSPADSAAFSDSRATSNPYLAALDLSPAPQVKLFLTQELPVLSPFGSPEVSSGLSSLGEGLKPADNSRTFVPDFAQPPDDDKYFKQMKRF
jgi:hypothetical protein